MLFLAKMVNKINQLCRDPREISFKSCIAKAMVTNSDGLFSQTLPSSLNKWIGASTGPSNMNSFPCTKSRTSVLRFSKFVRQSLSNNLRGHSVDVTNILMKGRCPNFQDFTIPNIPALHRAPSSIFLVRSNPDATIIRLYHVLLEVNAKGHFHWVYSSMACILLEASD